MVLASDSPVTVDMVVFMETTLPCPLELYGLPDASVMDMPGINVEMLLFFFLS